MDNKQLLDLLAELECEIFYRIDGSNENDIPVDDLVDFHTPLKAFMEKVYKSGDKRSMFKVVGGS